MKHPAGPGAGSDGQYNPDEDNQLEQEDTLIDGGTDGVIDEVYSPPVSSPGMKRSAMTSFEEREGESLDHLLAVEEPDPAAEINGPLDSDVQWRSDSSERDSEFPPDEEVGRESSGRLVAPDEGSGPDTEDELVAFDVGIDGGADSAEEAAMHVIDGDQKR